MKFNFSLNILIVWERTKFFAFTSLTLLRVNWIIYCQSRSITFLVAHSRSFAMDIFTFFFILLLACQLISLNTSSTCWMLCVVDGRKCRNYYSEKLFQIQSLKRLRTSSRCVWHAFSARFHIDDDFKFQVIIDEQNAQPSECFDWGANSFHFICSSQFFFCCCCCAISFYSRFSLDIWVRMRRYEKRNV